MKVATISLIIYASLAAASRFSTFLSTIFQLNNPYLGVASQENSVNPRKEEFIDMIVRHTDFFLTQIGKEDENFATSLGHVFENPEELKANVYTMGEGLHLRNIQFNHQLPEGKTVKPPKSTLWSLIFASEEKMYYPPGEYAANVHYNQATETFSIGIMGGENPFFHYYNFRKNADTNDITFENKIMDISSLFLRRV